MIKLNDFRETIRSAGNLYINIYPVIEYPQKIKVLKKPYEESYSPGKWKKRIGDLVYFYGNAAKDSFDNTIDIENGLFGMIFRKYILDLLSENLSPLCQIKDLRSTLRIAKEIEGYQYADKITLQYELIIGIHHWQNTNFGITADLKINVLDKIRNERISYQEIKDRYGEDIRRSIWRSVQAFHKHLTPKGKRYATAMRDKFSNITDLLKEAFSVTGNEKTLDSNDGIIKIAFRPLEVIEVANDDAI